MAIKITNNGFDLFKQLYANGEIRFDHENDNSLTTTIRFTDESFYNDFEADNSNNEFSFVNSQIKEMTFSKDSGGNDLKCILEPVFEYLAPKLQDQYEFSSFLSMPTHLIRNIVGNSRNWDAGVTVVPGSSFTDFEFETIPNLFYEDLKKMANDNYYFKNEGLSFNDTYSLRLDFLNFSETINWDGNGSNFNTNVDINESIFENIIMFNNNVVENRIHPQKVHITLEGNDLNKSFLSDNTSPTFKQTFFNNQQMYHLVHDFVKVYYDQMSTVNSLDSRYKSLELLSGVYDEALDSSYSYNLLSEEVEANLDGGDLPISALDHLAIIEENQYANENGTALLERDRGEAADLLELAFDNCIKTSQKLIEFDSKTDSEIILHRVLKTNLETGTTQNFWISTINNSFSFTDTQVGVEDEYRYEIFSYVLCYGVKYANPNFNETDFTVTYNIQPMVSILEIPMGSKEIKITQPPQPTPNVYFKNIKHLPKNIKIVMNLNAHEEDGPFYPIESLNEKDTLDDNYDLMNPSFESSYFRYETDIGRFQIFRTSVKPKIGTNWGYENIKNADNVFIVSENNSTMVSYVDTIQPFQKYYYVIRSRNYFGYYSQPTHLYEVELTQDADETFLHVQNVDFAEQVESKHMMEKTMSKLFQIVPAIQQLSIPEDAASTINSITTLDQLPDLGDEGIEKVWNKQFKIRLTSKSTGKKIDFNINFNLNKIN